MGQSAVSTWEKFQNTSPEEQVPMCYFELGCCWHYFPQHVLVIGDIDLVPSTTQKFQSSASCPDEECVYHSAVTVFSILGVLHTFLRCFVLVRGKN